MLYWLYQRFIQPRDLDDDKKRREFILNVLLAGTICLVAALAVVTYTNYCVAGADFDGSHPISIAAMVLPFSGLLVLSRRGRSHLAAYLFVALLSLLASYSLFVWSILLPQGILMYSLIIVIAGILLSSSFAFWSAVIFVVILLLLTALGSKNLIAFETTWMQEPAGYNDALSYGATFVCVAVVSWLSNREIEGSLNRARMSEQELLIERDQLEIKVAERTKALEKAQTEKLLELHRFAEFGRFSATLLHDIANPLTTVSLNLEMLEEAEKSSMVKQVRQGIQHMENYVASARRQLRQESKIKVFDVATEINRVVDILRARAHINQVVLHKNVEPGLKIRGDSIRFDHIMSNVICNAIDAYHGSKTKKRQVTIAVVRQEDMVRIVVRDHGIGIVARDLKQIFEPFFTTKQRQQGTGIGLMITKRYTEEDFGGTIEVTSSVHRGTEFIILIPLYETT